LRVGEAYRAGRVAPEDTLCGPNCDPTCTARSVHFNVDDAGLRVYGLHYARDSALLPFFSVAFPLALDFCLGNDEQTLCLNFFLVDIHRTASQHSIPDLYIRELDRDSICHTGFAQWHPRISRTLRHLHLHIPRAVGSYGDQPGLPVKSGYLSDDVL